MSTDNLTEGLVPPVQIGAVVKDIDETARLLSAMWGVGPWDTKELTYTKETLVTGGPFKIKVAYTRLGNVKLELIQPLEGESIFSEFLMAKGEGLFNINFHLSNYHEMVSKMNECGCERVLGIVKAKHYSYFQTKPGGIIVEYAEE
jgi:methylmalonyl-CoA/ethylmalonyl-CoA epimerase